MGEKRPEKNYQEGWVTHKTFLVLRDSEGNAIKEIAIHIHAVSTKVEVYEDYPLTATISAGIDSPDELSSWNQFIKTEIVDPIYADPVKVNGFVMDDDEEE